MFGSFPLPVIARTLAKDGPTSNSSRTSDIFPCAHTETTTSHFQLTPTSMVGSFPLPVIALTLVKDGPNSNSSRTSDIFPCAHTETITHKTRVNCFTCGIALHENGVIAYKSGKMNYGAFFNPSRIYTSSIKQRLPKVIYNPDSEYFKQRNNLLEIVSETSEKLKLSTNTTHLAILFMDVALSHLPNIRVNLLPVYAATSVMLAAKSIELDERIPFITRLQRYSGLMMFKPREFAAAEQVILRELKWNLQCLTTVDLMDYYFSQGMLFSNDILTEELSDKSNNLEDTTLIEKSTGNNDLMLQINSILNTPLEKYSSVSLEKSISAPSSEDEVNDFTSALESLQIGDKENPNSSAGVTPVQRNKKRLFISDFSEVRILSLIHKLEKDSQKISNLIAKVASLSLTSFCFTFPFYLGRSIDFVLPYHQLLHYRFHLTLDTRFYGYDLKILSAACVSFIRKVNGIAISWNNQLSAISNNEVFEGSFAECLGQLETCYRSCFIKFTAPSNNFSSATKRAIQISKDSENKPPSSSFSITPVKPVLKQQQQNFSWLSTSYSHSATHNTSENNSAYKLAQCSKPLAFQETNKQAATSVLGIPSNINSAQQPLKNSTQNVYSNFQVINYATTTTNNHNNNGIQRQNTFQPTNNYLGLTRFGSNVI